MHINLLIKNVTFRKFFKIIVLNFNYYDALTRSYFTIPS